eukprot:6201979-Pleurochrysis_carterae.AAC.2
MVSMVHVASALLRFMWHLRFCASAPSLLLLSASLIMIITSIILLPPSNLGCLAIRATARFRHRTARLSAETGERQIQLLALVFRGADRSARRPAGLRAVSAADARAPVLRLPFHVDLCIPHPSAAGVQAVLGAAVTRAIRSRLRQALLRGRQHAYGERVMRLLCVPFIRQPCVAPLTLTCSA